MKIYTMDGQVHEFLDAYPWVTEHGTLEVHRNTPQSPGPVAGFPLINVQRWER